MIRNAASRWKNGVQTNFEVDLVNEVDLLGGKIAAYAYHQKEFSKAREDAYKNGKKGIKDYDDILHYLNWQTPRLEINSKKLMMHQKIIRAMPTHLAKIK